MLTRLSRRNASLTSAGTGICDRMYTRRPERPERMVGTTPSGVVVTRSVCSGCWADRELLNVWQSIRFVCISSCIWSTYTRQPGYTRSDARPLAEMAGRGRHLYPLYCVSDAGLARAAD